MLLVLRVGPFQTGRRARPAEQRGDNRNVYPQAAGFRGPSRPLVAPCPPPPRSAVLEPRGPVPPVPSLQILVR